MRVLFLGTPDFAVATMEAIHQSDNHEIVGVVTVPDRPAGRGRSLRPSAVAVRAEELGLKVLKPEKLRDPEFIEEVRSLNPEMGVVVAFRMMPEILWSLPTLGTFNIHASLLPNYRGAAPIHRAVMNGERETGVTSFLLDDKIDTGKILFRRKTEIGPDETTGQLHDRLMSLGAELAVETLDRIQSGDYQPVDQDELIAHRELHHAPKIFKADCYLNLEDSAGDVYNKIRGLSPYPGAVIACEIDGENIDLKILRAKMAESRNGGEKIDIDREKMYLNCSQGSIEILELQYPGKRAMDVKSFLAGWKGTKKWRVRKP